MKPRMRETITAISQMVMIVAIIDFLLNDLIVSYGRFPAVWAVASSELLANVED
jgi:hypothetical protein